MTQEIKAASKQPVEQESAVASPNAVDRRESIKLALSAAGVFSAGLLTVPLYRFLASPALDAQAGANQSSITLEGADSLPRGESLLFSFNSAPTLLIHHQDDTWVCFSAVCTHLSCTLRYDRSKKLIVCACHEGSFDSRTGTPLEGPPPSELTGYKVEMRDGAVVVSTA